MPIETQNIYPNCSTIARTVDVGGLTKVELLQEFRKHSISMNAYGERLIALLSFSESPHSCRLESVELRVRDLGFAEGTTSARLFATAGELGLGLCPLEVAPYLRLQYLEQPEGFWITIASPRPSDLSDVPSGFYLRRLEDGLWLRGYMATAEHVWDADDHLIFRKLER